MLLPGDIVYVDAGGGHTETAPEMRRLGRLVELANDYYALVDFGPARDGAWADPEYVGVQKVNRRRIGRVRRPGGKVEAGVPVRLAGPGRVVVGEAVEITAAYGKPAQMRRVG